MNAPVLRAHRHKPVYRVVRSGWANPLNASYSQQKPNNRWNTRDFPALYCCCSEKVARFVARDVLKFSGVVFEDLQPAGRPALLEVSWSGRVVDVASAKGIAAIAFPPNYPVGTSREETRAAATKWHEAGFQGVVCRSASLSRQGFSNWREPHQPWGELAIFVQNTRKGPQLLGIREHREWFI